VVVYGRQKHVSGRQRYVSGRQRAVSGRHRSPVVFIVFCHKLFSLNHLATDFTDYTGKKSKNQKVNGKKTKQKRNIRTQEPKNSRMASGGLPLRRIFNI
jgi:hypothetical protein